MLSTELGSRKDFVAPRIAADKSLSSALSTPPRDAIQLTCTSAFEEPMRIANVKLSAVPRADYR